MTREWRFIPSRTQRCGQATQLFFGKNRFDGRPRILRQRPKALPNGMVCSVPSMRSSARCFHERPAASRITSSTVFGIASGASVSPPALRGANATS